MVNLNKVFLMGNLTRDPVLRYLPSQTAVTEFGIAMNRKWKSPQGEDKEEVCFVDCSAFAKTAEMINQYFTKGKPIFVEGRLHYDSWEDKNGGGKRSRLKVVVDNFQFIGAPPGGGGGGSHASAPPSDYDPTEGAPAPRSAAPAGQARRPAPQAPADSGPPISDESHFKADDIPF